MSDDDPMLQIQAMTKSNNTSGGYFVAFWLGSYCGLVSQSFNT
jgi:hypothetical protein